MANTYDNIKQIQQLYKSAGTVFNDGLRLGDYTQNTNMEGTVKGSPGVMCRSFSLYVTDARTLFNSLFSIPIVTAPDTFTLKLSSNSINPLTGAQIVQVENTTAIKLDCSRLLNFTSTGGAYYLVSGFDDYFQKACYIVGPLFNPILAPRCLRYITNITCIDSVANQTLQLATTQYYELPYTDYGCIPPMLSLSPIGPYYRQVQSPGSITYQATVGTSYRRANWNTPLTATIGTVRPIVQDTSDIGGNIEGMTGFMAVYGYGYAPEMFKVNAIVPEIDKNNNNESIIGIPQYSEGWLDWAG